MAASWQELERAFIDDHQELSRGYREIVEAIEQDDHELAANIATRLDQVAGPHIEFEEHCLYPEVARSRGEEYVERLYREHADTVETLTEIEQHRRTTRMNSPNSVGWQGFNTVSIMQPLVGRCSAISQRSNLADKRTFWTS